MGQAKREYERDLADLLFGGPDDPCRKAFEQIVKIGGSEYRDQSPPSGKGRYYFESLDPRIESFETDNPDEILQCIFGQLGCVRLVRMKKNEWSVEDCENIFGTITETSDHCHADSKNGSNREGGTESYIDSHACEAIEFSATIRTPGAGTWQVAISIRPCKGAEGE